MRSDLTIFVPWLDLWVKVDVLGERGRGSAGRWQAICSMPRARRIGWLIAICEPLALESPASRPHPSGLIGGAREARALGLLMAQLKQPARN